MRFGFSSTQKYFTDFRWFERKELRDEQVLSQEDIKYIRGWTLSPLGYGYIFYITTRKLPEIFTLYLVTFLYSEVTDKLFHVEDLEEWRLQLVFGILAIIAALASLFSVIFTFRHGRRLSWNRGRFKYSWKDILNPTWEHFHSVDELRQSEQRFVRYNVIPSVVLCTLLLAGFAILFVLYPPVPS